MAALFQNVLTASFHGSIVIAAVLLLRLVLRKAPRKFICLLWLLAGLRLLMPFEIQSQLSLQPEPEIVTQIQSERVDLTKLPEALRPDTPVVVIPQEQETVTGQTVTAQENTVQADPVLTQVADPVKEPVTVEILAMLPWLWVAVALGFGVYTLVSYLRLKLLVRDAVKIPGGWESDKIETAFILGFIKPKIYIPVGMKPSVRRHILAHERTHLEKGDHWFKMVGFMVLAIHWFNPLVWAAYICLCKDIEMACDERVVQFMELEERKSYAAALLSCSTNRIHYGACPVAFGEVSVKERIKSVLHYRKPSFWLSLLAVIAVLFVSVCLLTNPPEAEPEEKVDAPAVQEKFPEEPPVEEVPEALSVAKPPMGDAIDPGWGLRMEAEAASATKVTLRMGLDHEVWDGTPLTFGWEYWIEGYNGTTWEKLPILVEDPTWEGSFGSELSYENNAAHSMGKAELDFSLIFGALPAGDYRLGKDITRGEETVPYYAWFRVYTNETLTAEEAEAYERCKAALDRVLEKSEYYVTVSETNAAGELWPVYEVMYANGKTRKDLYQGDTRINTYVTEGSQYPVMDWDRLFGLDTNMYVSFPAGASGISQQEVCFRGRWADRTGTEYVRDFRYCFDAGGLLESIEWTTTEIKSSVQPHRRTLTVNETAIFSTSAGNIWQRISSVDTYEPKESYEAAEESPWDIFFRIDDDLLEPGKGEMWLYSWNDSPYTGKVTTDDHYWLEQKVGNSWRILEEKAAPVWTDTVYTLQNLNQSIWVDWSELYGQLSPGFYRMGKNFYMNGESISQYAEFEIIADGTVSGDGGEAAMARVKRALEKIRGGSYHINHYYKVEDYHEDYFVTSAYWKYNNDYVWDIYDDGTREYRNSLLKNNPENEHWMTLFTWDGQQRIFFPKGASVISDGEISFVMTYAEGNFAYEYYLYSIYFDENGDIESMLVTNYTDYVEEPHISRNLYVVEKTPEGEIRGWVEQVKAKQ